MAENEANLSGPRTTTLGVDGGQASGPVEAYEEDWYRSLKALAERRRELAETDEPDELEPEVEPTSSDGVPQSPTPWMANASAETGPDAPEEAAEWALEAPPDPVEPVASSEPSIGEEAATEGSATPEPGPAPHEVASTEPVTVDMGSDRAEWESGPEPSPQGPTAQEPVLDAQAHDAPVDVEADTQPAPDEGDEHTAPGRLGAEALPVPVAVEPSAVEERAAVEEPLTNAVGGLTEPAVGGPEAPALVEPLEHVAAQAGPTLAEHPSVAEPPAEPEVVTAASLLAARDPQERRRGLIELSAREPLDEELEQICGLLLDPDREVRLLAVQTLAGFPDRVEDESVLRAIQDPDDEVRAAGVRLAAHREVCEVPLLAPLLATRRHPRTQRTVMDLLPSVIPPSGPSDEDVAAVVRAVGEMIPGPDDEEAVGLARIAHTLGTDRLIGTLALGEVERLGAVRLLRDETSTAVLRALAGLVADPIEEIRTTGHAAAEQVAPPPPPEPQGAPESPPVEPFPAVAARLDDPDPLERERAADDLRARDRMELLTWVLEGVTSGTPREAELAVLVAARMELLEAAAAVFDRATGLASQERMAFLDALRDLRPEAGILVEGLVSIEPTRRPQAVDLLWELCGSELIPRVPDLLADASPPVRVAALEGLGATADPRGVEVAEAALANDPSPAVRAAAVRTLGRCLQGSPTPALERALADPDPDVRSTALQSLPTTSDPEATELVSRSLSDPDERVRRAAMRRFAASVGTDRQAAWAVLRSCASRERGELVAALQETGSGLTGMAFEFLGSVDEQERVLAVEVVGWGGSPGCVEAAIHALADPSAQVRRSAVASLGRLREPSSAGALAKALVDPDPDVRIGAVGSLGLIDDESVLGALVTALKDPEPRVREAASRVLTEWSSPAVARRLAGVLAVPSLRGSAADLLTRIGPASVELLIDVLRQGDPALSPIVGELLQRVVGLDELLARLTAPDPDRRLRAVEAVGAVGGTTAVDALIRTLFDPDERIRVRSAQLLGTLADRRAEQAIRQAALEDPVPEVVRAANEALVSLGAEDGGRAA